MKKLVKSETDRYICGVCGGIAEYFGIDSTIVRLVFAALGIVGGGGILLYLAAAIIIPKEGAVTQDPQDWNESGQDEQD
ncbi:MAG: PspC domain-containing protein [Lachnospiraceae bacterium]|nr:PspC domain-containing protein [Lachnospiraceae bacterium]